MSLTDTERILVVGAGSIGRRHIENLKRLGCTAIAVCRRSEVDAAVTGAEFDIEGYGSLKAAEVWAPTCVVVANPTSAHVETATWAVEAGCSVLIEKPISHTLDGVDVLLELAHRSGLVVAIGSNLRFHPAIEKIRKIILGEELGRLLSVRVEVGAYLPDWHPGRDYRLDYSAQSELGGGAALTLIHELDYTMWIAGDIADCVGRWARVSNLDLDVEDVVEIIAKHYSGVMTSVHMDFLDRSYNRRSRWVCELGTLEWRWEDALWMLLPDGKQTVLWQVDGFDLNETYLQEMKDFLTSARSKSGQARASGEEGRRILQVLLDSRQAGELLS